MKLTTALCLDCGKTSKCKTVWRTYAEGEKETTVTICKNGCFKEGESIK